MLFNDNRSNRSWRVINLAIDATLLYLQLMPRKETKAEPKQGVVTTVSEDFVTALRNDPAIDPEVADRLNSVLLNGQDLSVDTLRRALFFEEPLP